jgi:hypothetical protein
VAAKRGRHTTVPPGLAPSIAWLDRLAAVRRLVFGPVRRLGHRYAPGTIRVRRAMPTGLDCIAYADGRLLTLFVAVEREHAEQVARLIGERFPAGVVPDKTRNRRSPFDGARRDD